MLHRFFLVIVLLLPLNVWAAPIKIGALPAADTLALYVAADEGLFVAHGLDVEIIPFRSAFELDAAMRGGALAGHFCDMINVILLQAGGIKQTIVAVTSWASPENRFFGIAVPEKSEAKTIQDIKGKKVAIGRATIIDFLLDCMLKQDNLPSNFVEHLDIKQIPVRLQMMLSGQLDAVLLPEPLISLVEVKGARVIRDTRTLDMPLAVVALRENQIDPNNIPAFQDALAEAMDRINAYPEKYRKVMLEKGLLSKAASAAYQIVRYDRKHTPAGLPSSEQIDFVLQWMNQAHLLRESPDISHLVFKPQH